MRKVIDNLINGQLDRNFGTLTFSDSSIEISMVSGDVYEGSFSIYAASEGLAEGTVLCDDYRMEIIGSDFSGSQDDVAFRFHAEEIPAGQDIRGNIIILSNRGEYLLPFNVHVEPSVLDSSLGPIRNVFHFTNLAKSNWQEALQIFYNPMFVEIFKEADRDALATYKCLSGVKGSEFNMDEFLVSMRKKTPVEFIASEKSIELENPVGVSRYSINISRNGWGYNHLIIDTEGDFLEVDKNDISQDDFLGNNYTAYYYIDEEKLHFGWNYGSIILKDSRYTTVIPVAVHKTRNDLVFRDMNLARNRGQVQIMELYQSYRLKKISLRIWLNESNKVVEQMLQSDPEDLLAKLYRIHIMVSQERYNETNWNLKLVKSAAISVKDTQPFLWCYYLYICSLTENYQDQAEDVLEEARFCYKINPNDWRIALLLSYMSEEYSNNPIRKWVMYEELYNGGCTSPVIYLEAAKIVLDNPTMLTKLEGFELQVLRYICKKNMLSEEVIFVIKALCERIKDYSESILKLLITCYREYQYDDLLSSICMILIKGNRTDTEAFEWYSYGIKQELKITRLYEYYMNSIDKSAPQEIPRTVLMYFSFHSDLDYETNAYLYSIVLNDREKDPDMFSRYRMQIMDYISGQLVAGHNNRYLAQLYRALIDDDMLTDENVANRVADIIFVHEVDAREYPEAKRVVLCYGHHEDEESYPIIKGYAEIPIYSSNYAVAIEDDEHRRYIISKPVSVVQLIPPGRLLLNLQLMIRDHVGLDVHCCMEHQMTFDVRMENEFRFRNLLEKGYFTKEYSQSITMKLIRFYYEQDRIEELDRFLDIINADNVSSFERAECIRYLVKRNQDDKALDWIYRFGPEGIDRTILVELLMGWLPVHLEVVTRYGRLLQQLLLLTASNGTLGKLCVQYLNDNVHGTLRTMRDVWRLTREMGIDSRDIEERIIIQYLYTGAYISEKSTILKNYALGVPDGNILRAALNEQCYEFFVYDAVANDDLFYVLTEAMETGLELDLACNLAYVKYYAENQDLIDDKIRPVLKDSLHILMSENRVLACFKDIAFIMPSMGYFANSSIVEYKTKPGTKVSIHYVLENEANDEYIEEKMDEVYGGVYSKVFSLFFGEKLMYYITEETDGENEILSESHSISKNDIDDNAPRGRYGMVNDICIGKTLHDYVTVDALLEDYYRRDYMVGRLFSVHKG